VPRRAACDGRRPKTFTVSAASLIVAKSGSGTISVGSGGIVTAGSVQVGSGGTVSLAGGLLDPVAAVTLAAGGTIAGFGTLEASLVDGGLVDASGGTLDLTGSVSGGGSLQLGAGSTLQLDAAVEGTPTVTFASGTATLILGNPGLNTSLFAAMTNIVVGDQIAFGSGTTITSLAYTPVAGGQDVVLDLIQDSTSGTITLNDVQFAGGANQFEFANPVSGDALLEAAMCFCAGVHIATPHGETPVEQLAVGDRVVTLRGEARRIVWIGVGTVLATRGRRNAATPRRRSSCGRARSPTMCRTRICG
jgi:hypothetical protein